MYKRISESRSPLFPRHVISRSTWHAIDPLFRSAAVAYGPRVVGMILTGLQDDGTAGLLAVKRCGGGVAIVQDPADALYPEMPRSALARVEVDYQLPVAKMGAVLHRLAHEAPGETLPVPHDIVVEAGIVAAPPESRKPCFSCVRITGALGWSRG